MDTHKPMTDVTFNTCTESNTGGVQSHLSTANSQQRLRPTAAYPPTKQSGLVLANDIHPPLQHEAPDPLFIIFLKKALFPSANLPLSASNRLSQARPWSTLCLRWAALVYCFISVVIFSVEIYNSSHRHHTGSFKGTKGNLDLDIIQTFMTARSNTTLFEGLSTRQRLSRIFSQWPPPTAFNAFLIRGDIHVDAMSVSACIWMTERDELGLLFSWAALWRGPISLLMTTTAIPGSLAHKALLRRLRSQREHLSLSSVSVHLLHVDGNDGSPNSYLNVARLFAPTPVVMLVPANLSTPPLISHDDVDSQKLLSAPLIISLVDQVWSSYSSLPILPPMVVQRNDPVWCTDRFFIQNTRATDWKECLWQFWIASFGEFGNMKATIQTPEAFAINNDAANPIRNRLSVRFRAEVCDRAARTMAILGVKNYRDGKRKLAWLKQACSQHTVEKIFRMT